MSAVGKICLYCSQPIQTEDRVAFCERCLTAHHEACWDRNGRCSTFRCSGTPRTMRGSDVPTVLHLALEHANEQPTICPFCNSTVYAGYIQAKRMDHPQTSGPGLVFAGKRKPRGEKGWLQRVVDLIRGERTWPLPGASLKARSCGKCRRLFLWGERIDEEFLQQHQVHLGERFCPHCGCELLPGEIVLNPNLTGAARFECETIPDFHKDWLGHNILDRFFLNRWYLSIKALPAHSCPQCHYTEVAGRPVYRFA